MSLRRPQHGDEDNASFEIAEVRLEHTKPGLNLHRQKDPIAAGRAEEAEGNHRFVRSEEKSIPQKSLADRIRAGTKGG
jgi:hypothetical protein